MRRPHHPRVPGRRDGGCPLHQDRGQDLPVRAGGVVGGHTVPAVPARGALAALLALALALVAVAPGTGRAVLAHDDCPHFDFDDLRLAVEDFDVVVLGALTGAGEAPAIEPEAYLRGSAVSRDLVLLDGASGCARADLPPPGARVLVALRQAPGGFQWPVPAALFVVEDGQAVNGADPPVSLPEDELVSRIRAVSGQYAVLATDPSEGVSIDWLRVVLPVSLAAILILAIGLALLRIWHRIEPE